MIQSSKINFERAFRILFWTMAISFLVLNLILKWTQVNSYAPEWGGFERNVIWGIQQIMLEKPLYTNPEGFPFAIIQYMPFYYHLVGFFGSIFSIDPLDSHQVYSLARMVSFACCIFSSVLLVLMARQFKIRSEIAFGLGIVAFLWMDRFAIAARPDSLKGLIFQLIIFCLIQFPEKRKRFVFSLAVLLSLFGFFTKQDGLVFSGILPLTILFCSGLKEGVLWAFITLAIQILCLFLFQKSFNGDFFSNVAGGLQNGISFSWFIGAFGSYFSLMAILFGIALLVAFEFAFEKNWKLNVLSAGLACSFFPSLLFSFKYGSGANYFLEATLISLLIFGIWLNNLPFKKLFFRPGSPQLLASLVFGLLFFVQAMQWFTGSFLNSEKALKENYLEQKSVADFFKDKPKARVLINLKRQWEECLTTLIPNQVICPQRDVAIQVFDAKGKIDFKPLHNSISNGQIEFVITETGQKPAFLDCDFSEFKEYKSIGNFQIWKFK